MVFAVNEQDRELAGVLEEQRRYYALRAREYDDGYRRTGQHDRGEAGNASWKAELASVQAAFDRVDLQGDAVELAGGSGVWSERLVGRVDMLTIIDASVEMLEENRRRLGAFAPKVVYNVVDLFEWEPQRTWDCCVFAFWLAKVPDVRLAAFLESVAAALRAGGIVCCVDKTTEIDTSTEYQRRSLNDGRRFTIIDHPRTPGRMVEAFAGAGMTVRCETFGPRFSLTSGTKA